VFESYIDELIEGQDFSRCLHLMEKNRFSLDHKVCPDFDPAEIVDQVPEEFAGVIEEFFDTTDWATLPVEGNLEDLNKANTPEQQKNAVQSLGVLISLGNKAAFDGLCSFLEALPCPENVEDTHFRVEILRHLTISREDQSKLARLLVKDLVALREEDRLTPDLIFRDPYFLDFLGLKDTFSEKDLETAILREMESFILELGAGFSFVARQKRITVDNEDYYLDLLFFHRKLKRLIAVELKLGKFKAAYKGQMELYLRWLEKYEKEPGEETSLGLILCAGKTTEQIELLQLDKTGIKVAEYMTELPKRELLEQKLHKAVELAQKRLEARAEK